MLIKIFGSNARVKILKAFLTRSEQKNYIRQLARDLDLQVNSVRRELDNLEKFGLLISFTASDEETKEKPKGGKQEKKYYRVNENFILFDEIKAIILKSQALYEEDFADRIKDVGSVKLLFLTGFFVGRVNSPTDILIVGEIDREKLNRIVSEFESEFGREINYTIMTEEEFIYRRDITDVFLYEILEGKNLKIINELGA